MSRNNKLRYMAEQLPPFPKVKEQMMELIEDEKPAMRVKKKSIQRDSAGNIIYVNHFRELKSIQDRMEALGYGHKHPKTAAAWAKYAAMVIAYDKQKNKATPQQKALIGLFILIVVIAVAKAQEFFGIKLF